MTTTAWDVLKAFDALAPADQHEVAAEILRKTAPGGPLPDAAFDELAAELFRRYDGEDAARGGA